MKAERAAEIEKLRSGLASSGTPPGQRPVPEPQRLKIGLGAYRATRIVGKIFDGIEEKHQGHGAIEGVIMRTARIVGAAVMGAAAVGAALVVFQIFKPQQKNETTVH